MSKENISQYFSMPIENLEILILDGYTPTGPKSYSADDSNKPASSKSILERVIGAIKSSVDETPQEFRELICVDLKYCERRASDEVNLAIMIVEQNVLAHFAIPFPPFSFAAYLLRTRIFDKLCNCG